MVTKKEPQWEVRQIIRLVIPLISRKLRYYLITGEKDNLLSLATLTSQKKELVGDEQSLMQHIISYEKPNSFYLGILINTNTLIGIDKGVCYHIWQIYNRGKDFSSLPKLNERDFAEFQEKMKKCFGIRKWQKYVVSVIL